jgi:hypothetical protein
VGDSGRGVVGLNWTVRLLACKSLDAIDAHRRRGIL